MLSPYLVKRKESKKENIKYKTKKLSMMKNDPWLNCLGRRKCESAER